MKFQSTRDKNLSVTLESAIQEGLASDGGLYVPVSWPDFSTQIQETQMDLLPFPEFANQILGSFCDQSSLSNELKEICQKAFSFPILLSEVADQTAELELYHGPTGAFKDFGARFLALSMEKISSMPAFSERYLRSNAPLVLVATSGDTGGAVASAFVTLTNSSVIILYPKGKISARQEKQLTTWGSQVEAFAVNGSFDDCQKIVKTAFQSDAWQKRYSLVSANSINIGRLLPQMVYFAWSSLQYLKKYAKEPGIIVPSGNLGNGVAAVWARKIGFPIREIVFSHNSNSAVSNFFQTGVWTPRPTQSTLANAMDVGNPSNFERLIHLYPDYEVLKKFVSAESISDSEIEDTIRLFRHRPVCPHTATAYATFKKRKEKGWILAATAHPAKFESIVEPLVGHPIEVPRALQEVLNRSSRSHEISNNLSELEKYVFS